MQLFVYAMFFGCLFLCLLLMLFQYVVWPRIDRHRRNIVGVEAARQLQAQAQINEAKVQEAFARLPVMRSSELVSLERADDCAICMAGNQDDRAWVILPCAHSELPPQTHPWDLDYTALGHAFTHLAVVLSRRVSQGLLPALDRLEQRRCEARCMRRLPAAHRCCRAGARCRARARRNRPAVY